MVEREGETGKERKDEVWGVGRERQGSSGWLRQGGDGMGGRGV